MALPGRGLVAAGLLNACVWGALRAAAAPDAQALFPAVASNDAARVEALVKSGADANATNEKGVTPLQFAALAGDERIALVLLEAGASVDAESADGITALEYAIAENHAAVVAVLCTHGANPNRVGKSGFTPVLMAAGLGQLDSLQALLSHGGQAGVAGRDGSTPLHAASLRSVAQLLLFSGADVNAQNAKGVRPLHVAASKGNLDVVELLVDNGALLDAREGGGGGTALEYASRNGHREVVEFLMKRMKLQESVLVAQGDDSDESEDQATVRRVQEGLAALGYDPGTKDGRVGAKTERAIRLFRRLQGSFASPTDKVTTQLVKDLEVANGDRLVLDDGTSIAAVCRYELRSPESGKVSITGGCRAVRSDARTASIDAGVRQLVRTMQKGQRIDVLWAEGKGLLATPAIAEAK